MNKEFLTEIFLKSSARLRATARKILGDSDSADDVLQDAFLRLWMQKEKISTDSHAEGILTVTVKNLSIDRIRETCSHPTTGLDEIVYDTEIENICDDDAVRRVDRAICTVLSERDRDILYRRERDGWEMDEIAEYYGLTEVNVRTIVSRGRKAVRNYLNRIQNERER